MFIRAMVRIFSFGERWNVPFNSAVALLNGTFHLSPNENILTIAQINIHYLYYRHYYLAHPNLVPRAFARFRGSGSPSSSPGPSSGGPHCEGRPSLGLGTRMLVPVPEPLNRAKALGTRLLTPHWDFSVTDYIKYYAYLCHLLSLDYLSLQHFLYYFS